MKKLSRVLIILLLSVLLFALAGCNNEQTAPSQESKYEDTYQEPEESAEEFDAADVSLRSTPDSSCFSAVGYDSAHSVLVVEFRDSGAQYAYYDFPLSEWSDFSSADSLGSYFNSYIKGSYDCERLS